MAVNEGTWGRLAFGVALGALGAGGYALLRGPAPEPPRSAGEHEEAGRPPERVIADLREQQQALDRRLRAIEVGAEPDGGYVALRNSIEDARRRLTAMEKNLGVAKAAGGAPGAPLNPSPGAPDPAANPDELRRTVLDTHATETARVEALRKLRGVEGGRTHEVVVAMIAVLKTSKDAKVREAVIRQLHGTKDLDLVEPLIDAMKHDADDPVRAKAAEDVDEFVADARVVEALKLVRDTDPSQRVRRRAAETLAKAPK